MRIESTMVVVCPQCKRQHGHDLQLVAADAVPEYFFVCLECGLVRNLMESPGVLSALARLRIERAQVEEELRLESIWKRNQLCA